MEPSVVIGVDLGVVAPSEVAVARGSVIESGRRVASTPRGLTEALRAAAGERPVGIVVESTAMAWFVAAVAAARAGITHTLHRVSGTKAAALRAFYRAHTKTDHIDARVLARMPAVDDALAAFRLPSPAELSLRRLVGLRHKLGTAATKTANQIRSMLHWAAPGILRAAGGSVGPGLVAVLGRWPDLRGLARARAATIATTGGWAPERARAVRQAAAEAAAFYEGFVDFADLALELEVALSQLGCLKAAQSRVEARVAAMHEALFPDDRLLTIPGVGPVVAGVVRAVAGDLGRFTNLAAFRAYTGLVAREDSSGEARRRGRISKAGPAVLRWALYLAADAARQVDPALADLYRRLMAERGRTHTQALCAVASHLAGRIWAVARGNRDYQWRDLTGKPISREQARAIARSLRVDQATRARLRARRTGGPGASRTRQHEASHDATQPSADKVIEDALEVARKA